MRIETDTINLKENLVLKETFDGVVFEKSVRRNIIEMLCVSNPADGGFEIGIFEKGNRKQYSVKNGKIEKITLPKINMWIEFEKFCEEKGISTKRLEDYEAWYHCFGAGWELGKESSK